MSDPKYKNPTQAWSALGKITKLEDAERWLKDTEWMVDGNQEWPTDQFWGRGGSHFREMRRNTAARVGLTKHRRAKPVPKHA